MGLKMSILDIGCFLSPIYHKWEFFTQQIALSEIPFSSEKRDISDDILPVGFIFQGTKPPPLLHISATRHTLAQMYTPYRDIYTLAQYTV